MQKPPLESSHKQIEYTSDWSAELPETRSAGGGNLTFGTPPDAKKMGAQKISSLEKGLYKPVVNKDKLAEEDLTVRRSFRLWLDKVTGVQAEKRSQLEQIQYDDLADEGNCIRQFCASVNGSSNTESCALCGFHFRQKYQKLRTQKKFLTNGTVDVAKNKDLNVTMTYSDVSITNNERMVMCACYKGFGPYADSENGFQAVRELAAVYSLVATFYALMVNSSLFSWLVASGIMIALLFTTNTARVSTDYVADQRFYFADQIGSLNKRNAALQKQYNRLRMAVDS